MTSQMTKPVETLCQNTYSICANCKSLSKADMAKKHIDIREATEKITQLLDQSLPFEYFEKIWYKSSHLRGAPCWVDAYDDYNEGTQSSKDILTSYCCPMRDENGKFIGSITASLTLKWLSEAVTQIKPFPNSSAIMIDRTGTYLVHPDTAKLFRETIFSDADPRARREIHSLGKAMIAGHSGMILTIVDGQSSTIHWSVQVGVSPSCVLQAMCSRDTNNCSTQSGS